MDLIVLFFIFITSLAAYFYFVKKPSNFPPGPMPFPIIGTLSAIAPDNYIAFEKMSKKYGPIVGVKFGPHAAICLHGTKLIKEAFNELTFSGRFVSEARSFIADENGIVASSGDTWTEQRRFALRHLRDFGFGKSSMEELIMDEVREVSDWLSSQNGNLVSLRGRFSLAVVNSLWRILSGERFNHDDVKLHQILDDTQATGSAVFTIESVKGFIISFYPTIAKMFQKWSGWGNLISAFNKKSGIFQKIIEEHRETMQEGAPRDFLDVYLQEIHNATNPASSFYSQKGEKCLRSVMKEFFIAGADTTSSTLTFLNLYLLHNPRVQEKLHQELDRVVGRSRLVCLGDRKSLPYTEALILESLRLSSIVPLAVPHTTMEDVKFHGYELPKGTIVFANLYANHRDPEIWGADADEFLPERFLSADGTTVVRHEALIPFSIGRRVCLGEGLARDTLFLFVANLALKFEVALEGQEIPSLVGKRGTTLTPVSSTVLMKKRH